MSSSKQWSMESVPALSGKVAIVSGANTGLGFETAKALALKGAHVVMACRNSKKAEEAKAKILELLPSAHLEVGILDLGELASVRRFAERQKQNHASISLLINNAGLMMPPYGQTKDGFEQQWGVNYLGHFLLTALLMDNLERTRNARVVHLASLAHKWGEIYFDDLNFERKYSKTKSYGQSKLACLMFAFEMQRRLTAAGCSTLSVGAHPGISDTELSRYLPGWMRALNPIFTTLIAQPASGGALPTLRAALDPELSGGEYIGPDGFGGYKGQPVVVDAHPKAENKEVARKLWEVSEKLSGQKFDIQK